MPAAAPRRPQAYISAVQAAAACASAGKRLCGLSEWLAACRGPHNYTCLVHYINASRGSATRLVAIIMKRPMGRRSRYPYGNTYMAGYCNENRATNPVNDLFGAHATFNRASPTQQLSLSSSFSSLYGCPLGPHSLAQ